MRPILERDWPQRISRSCPGFRVTFRNRRLQTDTARLELPANVPIAIRRDESDIWTERERLLSNPDMTAGFPGTGEPRGITERATLTNDAP